MLIRNLAGVFSASGFVARQGRRVGADDCGFIPGPVNIAIDDATGRIVEIAAGANAGGDVVDGDGCLALPGFIDPHTHPVFAGERSNEYFMRWAGRTYLEITEAGGGIHSTVRATNDASDDQLLRDLNARLAFMQSCGATTVEAKSGYANSAAGELRLLRVLNRARENADNPRLRISFLALHALPRGRPENDYVDDMIGALDEVARDGLADQVDTFPERGFFTKENALRFSLEARARSLPCKVHADELCDLGSSLAFVQIGALSVDHLQYIADDAVAALAAAPTVATMLPATSFFVGIPYANARRLIDAGARVALATDFNPGTAPAMDLQLTHMLAASQLKMSPAEILCASTFNAAGAIGLDDEIGALMPGRMGDVLLYSREGARSTDAMRELERIILSRARPMRVIRQGR